MSDHLVTPIGLATQQCVIDEVQRYIRLAGEQYHRAFESIDVVFDLKGKTAGMYRVKRLPSQVLGVPSSVVRHIRFNPWIFAKYSDDSWHNTIPHEVAHYIVDCLYGLGAVKPHGSQWQSVMAGFGAVASVRARYDLTGIPMRKVKHYPYQCLCRRVDLSSYRHNKIQRGVQSYRCRDCLGELVWLQE